MKRTLLTAIVASPLALTAMAQEDPPKPPAEERGLKLKSEKATPGLTLYAPLRSRKTLLIDLDGNVKHEWESDCPPGNSVYLQDNGDLIRCGRVSNDLFHGGGQGGKVQRIAWDGTVLWDLDLSNEDMLAHHDIAVMPNGNLLVIAWENKSRDETLYAGRAESQLSEDGFWPDMVLELAVDESGQAKRVWEWHSFDHLIQDENEDGRFYGSVPDHPERIDINGDFRTDRPMTEAERERQKEREEEMRKLGYVGGHDDDQDDDDDSDRDGGRADWMHTNSIDYLPEHDLIMISVRTFNEVWVIDHSTTTAEARGSTGGRYGKGGDLLFRFGNPRVSGQGEESEQRLFRQHDASWIGQSERGLHVLVFNNGEGRAEEGFSTVDEFLLPFNAETGFGKTRAEHIWSYGDKEGQDFFASFVSGAQRLPSGNTLICHGVDGRLFEVTPEGETVWDYLNPVVGTESSMAGGGMGRGRGMGRGPRRGPPGDGPPDGGRGRDDRGPRGGDRDGGPPGRDRDGGPGGRDGGRDRGPRGDRGGPGGDGMLRHGMFRGTRIPADHPGLKGKF